MLIKNLEHEKIKTNLSDIELTLQTSILSEVNSNNKPVYSNETLRSAELASRKNKDKNYINGEVLLNNAYQELSRLKIQLNYLNNDFKAVRELSNLYAAYIQR